MSTKDTKSKAINLIKQLNKFGTQIVSSRQTRDFLLLSLNNSGLEPLTIYKLKKEVEEDINKEANAYHVINNLIIKLKELYRDQSGNLEDGQ